MGVRMEALLEDADADERAQVAMWESSPEGRVWHLEQEAVRTAEEEVRKRQERVWARLHKGEWQEWVLIRPLLAPSYDFGAEKGFDFEDFLQEVGRRPSPAHRVRRRDKTLPYQRGNLRWSVRKPSTKRSPYLNAREAATFLGIALRTLYNNRRHIPSLPGFKRLMFDPKVLKEVRASQRFRTLRLADQRRKRAQPTS